MRFMWKEGKSQKQILERLQAVHGRAALSKSSVQRWVSRFQSEGDNVADHPKTGRKTVRHQFTGAVQQALNVERRSTVRQVAAKVGLSVGTTHKIIAKDLKMRKPPAKWVPHLLTAAQKLRRMNLARQSLAMMRSTRHQRGVQRVVAQDESWFHTWDPESKEASRQWINAGQSRPDIVRREISIPKSMLVVFLDRDGVIYHEFVPAGRGINRIIYQGILTRFREALRRRCPLLWNETLPWVLLQDGAPAHNADSTQRFLRYNSIKTLPHPGYSPDLNPCDYWFFTRVKKIVKGVRHRTLNELKTAVERAIQGIDQAEFAAAMDRLVPRLQKCVDVRGSYFEHE